MLQRTALLQLKKWAQMPNRKPLVLRGARQVGKTTLVKMFANEFDQCVFINAEFRNDRELFEKYNDINELIDAIFFHKNMKKEDGKKLIFIDEIQNAPEAIEQLRYFFEEAGTYYVITAGSLLESYIGRHVSFPVGRVEYMPVYPLNFREFLQGINDQTTLDELEKLPVNSYAHEKLKSYFNKYTLIGGMPEVVNNFIEHNDLMALAPIYDNLIQSYKEDIEKYAHTKSQSEIIRHVMDNVFYEAGKRIKFQGFGNSNYRSREVKEALTNIERALLIHLIYPVTSTKIPLQPNFKKSPKLQMLDIGLVNYVVKLQKDLFGTNDISETYGGLIAEQVVGQELIAQQKNVTEKCRFWTREKDTDAEVDFVHVYENIVLPIEVKSGSSGRLRSLHEYIERSEHKIGIRVYSGEFNVEKSKTRYGTEFQLINLPFYLVHKINDVLKFVLEG